jgi:ankyrin repeat protein
MNFWQRLKTGADLDRCDSQCGTALMMAVGKGRDDAIKALFDAGADLGLPNNDADNGLSAVDVAHRRSVTRNRNLTRALDNGLRVFVGGSHRDDILRDRRFDSPLPIKG